MRYLMDQLWRIRYGEDSKLIYDLQDQGGELCSLRYDLTVSPAGPCLYIYDSSTKPACLAASRF